MTCKRLNALLRAQAAPLFRYVSPFLPQFLMPRSVQLEPTTRCNFKCRTCLRSGSTGFDMSFDLFKSIVDPLKSPGRQGLSLTGLGEPLLHPRLTEMVRYAKARDLYVGFFSNFAIMNRTIAAELIDAELDWVSVSFDGASKETFERLRVGAVFEEVVENVKALVKIKKEAGLLKPHVFMSVTVCEENVGEIPCLVNTAKELDVEGIHLIPHIQVGHTFPQREIASVLNRVQQSGKVRTSVLAGRPNAHCGAVDSCYVTYDGKVLACGCLMEIVPREEYAEVEFGDLRKESLSQVWFSRRYKQFRRALMMGRHPKFCSYCPLSS